MSAATGHGIDKLFTKVDCIVSVAHLMLLTFFVCQISEAGAEFQEIYLPDLERYSSVLRFVSFRAAELTIPPTDALLTGKLLRMRATPLKWKEFDR